MRPNDKPTAMSDSPLRTPVAFLIFNRPALTGRVFERIREAKPPKLLIVADGPRTNHPDDAEKCRLARKIVDAGVDWPCDVLRNYSETNLGCRRRVARGLDWVFDQVEEAIILEDDVLPHPTFFPYCEELLERYRVDERLMVICGAKFFQEELSLGASYAFARFPLVWGWASWRRAWRHYDVEMQRWPAIRQQGGLSALLEDSAWARHLQPAFEETFSGRCDTWDTQLTFDCLRQSGLAIYPAVNLVSNIGFGADATHTIADTGATNCLPTSAMTFPLTHAQEVFPDRRAELATLRTITLRAPLVARMRARLARLAGGAPKPKR